MEIIVVWMYFFWQQLTDIPVMMTLTAPVPMLAYWTLPSGIPAERKIDVE